MKINEVLAQMEAWGTAQNRKIYIRHGAREPLFGVSFANLKKLQKKIKWNHPLALTLWETGNLDAMSLATMIAVPAEATELMLDKWSTALYCNALAGLFSSYCAATQFANKKMQHWINSEKDMVASCGWNILAKMAMQNKDLPNNFFEKYLQIIKKTIHQNKNFTKHAMNNALIAIGLRNDTLGTQAITIARTIGKVQVDYGETNCKTPAAEKYILAAKKRHGVC